MSRAPTEISAERRALIERIFRDSPFVCDIGIEFVDCGPGWCETRLPLALRHTQFTGVTHAGVVTTLADHSAGAAAATLLEPGRLLLTSEFKLSLLRPGGGDRLTCRAQVLKSGRLISYVEAEVFAWRAEKRTLIGKLSASMVTIEGQP